MKLRICCSPLSCALSPSSRVRAKDRLIRRSDIPHLRKQGTATQLIVDGKPFLALAGELRNNSATSLEYMKPIWPKLVAGQTQHRPGGRFLEPDRTPGRASSTSVCWTA